MVKEMQNVYPTLRITNYEKSKAFYVDGLGFQIEGEHRFAPHLPVFMTISRDGLRVSAFHNLPVKRTYHDGT